MMWIIQVTGGLRPRSLLSTVYYPEEYLMIKVSISDVVGSFVLITLHPSTSRYTKRKCIRALQSESNSSFGRESVDFGIIRACVEQVR